MPADDTAPDSFAIRPNLDLQDLAFPDALARASDMAQSYLSHMLHSDKSDVAQAMLYATAGGKGLRAFLVVESARLFGIDRGASQPAAAAIEAMHAYSLIHDDLPCMDDDDMRRGKPTVHKKWNEHTAVLAGDALQAMAFQCLAQTESSAENKVKLLQTLAIRAGVAGMVGGQALDIAAETSNQPLSLQDITELQAGKTGALIKWSSVAGAVMAGENTTSLDTYGDRLGLAFQIADDILDVEGDAATVGKAVGKDAGAGKATFVSLLGLDGAKRRAADLVTQACDVLSIYGKDADCLREAARFVISRRS